MGEGGEEGEDDEDDPVSDVRTCEGFTPSLGFTSASSMQDDLASPLYLGNQLGLTTTMVGEVVQDVGLVGGQSGAGVNTGHVDMMMGVGGVGQQGGAMASTSYKVSIPCGCLLLPTSVKQVSSAFSTYLGNQLGITFMVRGFQARHWDVVVVGCSCWVGVFVEAAVPGEGSGVGVGQHQDVATYGAAQQWQM